MISGKAGKPGTQAKVPPAYQVKQLQAALQLNSTFQQANLNATPAFII
jgi:hypothetical protein